MYNDIFKGYFAEKECKCGLSFRVILQIAKDENNFRLLFFSIFMLLGISISAESNTNNGRIDAVASNEDFVFVFDFKLDKTEEIALQQI